MDSFNFQKFDLNQRFVAKPSGSNMMMMPPSLTVPNSNIGNGRLLSLTLMKTF